MKIISLLAAFVALGLIIVPAHSEPGQSSCMCPPNGCHENPIDNCCSKSPDSCTPSNCACLGPLASYPGLEYSDMGYSNLSKSGTRSPSRSSLDSPNSPSNTDLLSSVFSASSGSKRPPDPDVVEYLPPSARRVFCVLSSDGPLTQKDIISRTDLPPRTVRYALDRLRGEEMLEERFCFSDARQSIYCLTGTEKR